MPSRTPGSLRLGGHHSRERLPCCHRAPLACPCHARRVPRGDPPMTEKKLPGWLSLLLVGGTLGTLLWLERRRPLRRAVEPKPRREGRNLAVAALSATA